MAENARIHLTLSETTLKWLPTVAKEHRDKKQKPEPLSVRKWVFDQFRQVAINQGQSVNLLKARGYVEFQNRAPGDSREPTKKDRVTVEDLKADDYKPSPKTEDSNFEAEMTPANMERLQWAVAMLNTLAREGLIAGQEVFDSLEGWAEDYLVRVVSQAYTEYENRALGSEELHEDTHSEAKS